MERSWKRTALRSNLAVQVQTPCHTLAEQICRSMNLQMRQQLQLPSAANAEASDSQ